MLIIAITSYDRCGKDTAGEYLYKKFKDRGYKIGIGSFADKLKEMVADMLNIDRYILDKMKNDNMLLGLGYELVPTRDILIKFGTALRKQLGDDIFARLLLQDKLNKGYDVFIIPDLRFLGEEKAVRDFNGYIIRLESNISTCGKNGIRYEVPKIKHDVVVTNTSGMIGRMQEELDRVMRYLIKNRLEIENEKS